MGKNMAEQILSQTEEGQSFLDELADEIGYPEDRGKNERVLRSFLHALRDRLEVEDALALIDLLPSFLKGTLVDGWVYKQKPVALQNVQD